MRGTRRTRGNRITEESARKSRGNLVRSKQSPEPHLYAAGGPRCGNSPLLCAMVGILVTTCPSAHLSHARKAPVPAHVLGCDRPRGVNSNPLLILTKTVTLTPSISGTGARATCLQHEACANDNGHGAHSGHVLSLRVANPLYALWL